MRRLVSILRGHGVLDGMWTLAASVGSKVQMLVLMAIAGRASGLDAVGMVILAISIGYLVAAVVDLGLSTQVARWFAREPGAFRQALLVPALVRTAVIVPLSYAVATLLFTSSFPAVGDGGWAAATAALSAGYCLSLVLTQAAYGSGRFRQTASFNGAVRLGSILGLATASLLGAQMWVLLLVVAASEGLIAALQYYALPSNGEAPTADLTPAQTWAFAVGPVANNLMNRSDTVVVAAVAGASVVGSYGLASQIENALTTVALVPAGAATVYAARRALDDRLNGQLKVVALVVGACYLLMAIPVIIVPSFFTELLFGVVPPSDIPIRLCLIAGLFSCLAGVAIMMLNGAGDGRGVASIWVGTAATSVFGLLVGAWLFGAVGAAAGALLRDVLLWTLAWWRLRTIMRRRSND